MSRSSSLVILCVLTACASSLAVGGESTDSTMAPGEPMAEEVGGDGEAAPASRTAMAYDAVATGAPQASEADSAGEPNAPQSWRRVTGASRFASVSLGGGNTLDLERVRVHVQVEGLRARTIVDHIFHNPHGRALEGTFRYPLPPEATISSYAMYLGSGAQVAPDFFGSDVQLPRGVRVEQMLQQVDPQAWGELRVGRIVKQERGREVYENVTRRRIDPALVEEVAPNTFEARVFPIQANGFHRVIVSYEQTLPRVGSELEYLFPVPEAELDSFEVDVMAPGRARYTGDFAGVARRRGNGATFFGARIEGETQRGTLAFRIPTASGPEVLVGAHPERDERHFLVRLHGDPRLPAQGSVAPTAVFLVDTSLSEDPDRFNLDVALLRQILERSPGIRRFHVIGFDAGARLLTPNGGLVNSADGRARATGLLENVLLEGATDLSAALDRLASMMGGMREAPDVFVLTDGALSWGERDADTLLRRFRAQVRAMPRIFAYRTGLGAENLALLRRLTQTGGVFNCLSTSSLPGCATAHHAPGLRIESVAVVANGRSVAEDVLVAGGAATLSREGELVIAGKLLASGPATLRLQGKVGGQARTLEVPLRLEPRGELASRAWAEIAVAHLIATHDADLEDLAVALSQHYRIPTRLTSFLVLETDAEYEMYDLQAERRELQGAEIAALVRNVQAQRTHGRTSWQRLERALRAGQAHHRIDPQVYERIASFVARQPVDFLRGRVDVPMVAASDAPRRYRNHRSHDPEAAEMYRTEGERRRAEGNVGAAIRALSSAVENAPSNAEIARMVGYTLDSWDADAEAAELFLGVLEQRPYEPQSYRDLALVLWTRRPSLTALLYEAVLGGEWDGRFRGVVDIAREEYALFARAWRRQSPQSPLAQYLASREQTLGLTVPSADLRVTMTWNTDNTDIDLWVTDPEGDECYYGNRRIPSGGELLADVTQGFGPERFQATQAIDGEYRVVAKYYGNNGNRLLAQTYVTLTVATHVGTDRERVRRFVVSLNDRGDEATVARIRVR